MKLNHLNLTVSDVAKAHDFLQKHFGLRDMGRSNDTMAGLYDDDGFALVLMKAAARPRSPTRRASTSASRRRATRT